MPTLVIRHPDGTTEEREVVGRLTVGADEGNDLVLRAHGVSQRHAQFFADGGELVLENVGSAAATLVDGETLGSPRKLKQGVRVLIGGYEVSLKPNQVSVRRLHPVASPERTLEDDAPPRAPAAAPGSTGGLWLVAVPLLAVVAVAAFVLWPKPPAAVEVPLPLPPQPCTELEPQLKIAREEPSERARAAANTVLDCDPLNPEALALKRHLDRELLGAAAAERGVKLVELGRDDQALEAFKELPEGTKAFVSSRQVALEAAARIRGDSSKACLAYARDRKWLQAEPACERALELTCQGLSNDELGRHPLQLALSKAREANDPAAPRWKCPALPMFRPVAAQEDPSKALQAGIAKRISDPQMAAAVLLYAQGKINEAITQLQIIKEKSSKAPAHAQAEALRKDMANVDSLKKIGDGLLKKQDLEKAAKTYREALELDARLVEDFERTPSVSRRAIQDEMAAAALRIGGPMARRSDLPRACAVFRTGFAFFKGSQALNEALAECSAKARLLLDGARTCAELDRALALAVPPDGITEGIAAQKSQLNCR